MRRRSLVGLACGLVLALSQAGSVPAQRPEGYFGVREIGGRAWRFGGVSAISVTSDGLGFVALTDRGDVLRGVLKRGRKGRIIAMKVQSLLTLQSPLGGPLWRSQADSEGLAIGLGNRVCISFEMDIRVVCYDPIEGAGQRLPWAPAFAHLPPNGAMEALTFGPGDELFAVPETPPTVDLPVYVFANGQWETESYHLSRSGGFHPVSADFGPDGRFYLLERRFHGLRGFSSRLRRFDFGPGGFSAGITLLQSPPGLHDNLEGLSVWRAHDGLRATMISDDNFMPFQVTEIVEYRLPD